MTISNCLGNKILARLPDQDFQRIAGLIEKVCPEVGMVVAYPDKEPKYVHFPISGVLSSMVVLEDGSTVEASTIGNEGMDGLYCLPIHWPILTASTCRSRGTCSGCPQVLSSGLFMRAMRCRSC